MELRDLRVLVQVVESGGVTRAARELHLVQSAVSQAVARVERECGVSLFIRHPEGVRPTEAGRELVGYARRILGLVSEAEWAMAAKRETVRGRIHLGMLPSLTPLLLGGMLRRLRAAQPELVVEIEEGLRDDLLARTREGHIDIAVIWTAPGDTARGVEGLFEIPLCAVLACDHRFAGSPELQLTDLKAEAWITFPAGGPGHHWVVDACERSGFKPRVVVEVGTLGAVHGFVQAGVGVTLLPRAAVAPEVATSLLVAVPIREPALVATLGWVVRDGRRDPAVAAVRTALTETTSDATRAVG